VDIKLMRELVEAEEFSEHCGCEDDAVVEGRAEAEKAIWNFFPRDSKAKLRGHKSVMFTGDVAKAAKVPNYTTIKLSDLTDHQIASVLAVIQKKGESALDTMPVENVLMHEETSDLVRHCVRAVAEKYGGDTKKAFAICNAKLQRDGYLEPGSSKLTPAGKAREKKHAADPDAPKKLADYERMLKKSRSESSLGEIRKLIGLSEAPKQTYAQAQADIMTGLEKDGWKVNKSLKVPHATSPDGKHKLWFKAQAIYLSKGNEQLGAARSVHAGDIRDGGYDKFSNYLSRWTGSKPKATMPTKDEPFGKSTGDTKTFVNTPGVVTFDPSKAKLTPDQYHSKHGKCPEGYHWNEGVKRCLKADNEAKQHLCPECNEQMFYVEETDDWACDGCGIPDKKKNKDEKPGKPKMPKAVKRPADESIGEFERLAGVQRYPDRTVVTEEPLSALEREYAGIADAHEGWRLQPLWPQQEAKVPCGKCGKTEYKDIRGRLGDCCMGGKKTQK
jgi:ribosomal protein S27AE